MSETPKPLTPDERADLATLRAKLDAAEQALAALTAPTEEHDALFIITRDWLHDHATKGMGWTRKQMDLLGVEWPQRKGWLSGLCGKAIPVATRLEFERLCLERRAKITRLAAKEGGQL